MKPEAPHSSLDRYDRRILEALQQDAGLSNQRLAEKIGLSPSPCLRRVQALEESGIIRQRVALLQPEKIGLELMVLMHISMDRHTPERFEHFESTIKQSPEVLECFLITGHDADYQLKVVLRDMAHFQDFLLNRLTRIEGVTGVHSSFILRKIIDKTELPL
ncbi:Lrp/AsnC family transcriptional regulator [Acidithiobacillus montserratensis]|uniref:Lrp/AsnC family transcriptional regulator n=1 Tax=Acidithiobacillus montserratensis TaxID=2729135 RepID=A0ACD5HK99_9PROT|nr:Lrp/AsnC family transcriptional regulator [Acidithiobacillus montserratensis]MBN2679579.1 Lrp/AsnC family transcriptional regulator [Acidithiobacillaceae bacterium]MBU2749314.1 Lrp/AsnC family transcriptional regulator [Acidithiobacillus montserratensis]